MNQCKTCKHWHDDDADHWEWRIRPHHPVTYTNLTDDELRATGHPEVHHCNAPKIVFYQYPEHTGAAVMDGSEYRAALLTAEDFGCVLHELP